MEVMFVAMINLICAAMVARRAQAWTCASSCGGIALNYPFGSGWNCGDPSIQPYVNCSTNGELLFYTPTGSYPVQAIDYNNHRILIQDDSMSQCSQMRMSASFGLPVGAPFSFAPASIIVLIGCSSTSSLFAKQSCSSSATDSQICSALYSCPGVVELGMSLNSSTSSCCVVSNYLLQTAPYEIDLPLLQCSSYTSIYQMGSLNAPLTTWSYGIALQYTAPSSSSSSSTSGSTGQNSYCYACQEAEDSGAMPALRSLTGVSRLIVAMAVQILLS